MIFGCDEEFVVDISRDYSWNDMIDTQIWLFARNNYPSLPEKV
jgi:hypothetical protein